MILNYFKIAIRNLLRKKAYALINIGGLAMGMTVGCLIGLWIADELSFNHYHKQHDTIAQVYRQEMVEGEMEVSTSHVTALAHLLRTTYGSHFKEVVMMRGRAEDRVLTSAGKKFTQSGYFMEPRGVELFSLKMIAGTGDGLKDMRSIILSESLARKFFGNKNPLNETLTMDADTPLLVTGVYEDLPKNSEFAGAGFFAPIELYVLGSGPNTLNSWDNYFINIYVQLHPSSDPEKISTIIRDATKPYIQDKSKQTLFLHPMGEWHLNAEFKSGVLVPSKAMVAVWSFGAIGVFVLLLACINFMNLSTARSENRAKEVGIRKTMGSLRSQLLYQFYGESFVVAVIAFILSLGVVQILLPWFNSMSDKNISVPWTSLTFWLTAVMLVLVAATLAGSYPALYLSSFNPVKVLKGTFKAGRAAALPRKVLVVLQFTVSIALAIGTIVIYQQIQFAKDRSVGYTRAGLIEMRSTQPEYQNNYDVLRTELKNTGVVEEICQANYSITDTRGWNDGFSWEGHVYEPSFNTIFVSPEYGKTVGWEFIEGRDFSRETAGDSASIILNESALRVLNINNPIGAYLRWAPGGTDRGTFRIVGVVKDMVKGSPYEATFPSIIFASTNKMRWTYIRMNNNVSSHEALAKIEKVFARLIPSAPFDYKFADDAYAAKFDAEERVGMLAGFFSIQAVLISLLGLFGLASFVAEQRTKEIGIRKVLGASLTNLWKMLSKDFVSLVIIACVIAVPFSTYFMTGWLQRYEYRTELSPMVFISTCTGALLITVLTVSFQTLKAALVNPVKSLRSE